MAGADALITSWDSKTHYVFWRPLTAIQEGDHDGNPHTAGDPAWQPLINNPNYPDYTSGANCLTGAMTRTLQLFFGMDKVTFEPPRTLLWRSRRRRTYPAFSEANAGCRGRAHLVGNSLPLYRPRGAHTGPACSRMDVQPFSAATRRSEY
jgi:hypothetical protein